jgi:hypothetical protein
MVAKVTITTFFSVQKFEASSKMIVRQEVMEETNSPTF